MPLTWGDWLRFIVAPLVVAGITAIVATRNAKKTPHERLKHLVDIHKNMPADLDSRKVVESAIARELVDFNRRLTADQQGFWAGVRERVAQLDVPLLCAIFLFFGFTGAFLAPILVPDLWAVPITVVIGFVGSGVAYAGARAVSKRERDALNRERATAEIYSHFSKEQIDSLATNGDVTFRGYDFFLPAAERLTEMGVLERKGPIGSPDVPELQIHRFVLTPRGREAIPTWLVKVRDDDPGRSAPGA